MNWTTAATGFTELARKKPALATVLVLTAVVGYLFYVHFGPRYAHADDLSALEQRVTDNTEDVVDLKAEVQAGRLEGLGGQLFAARIDQCRAESDELKAVYAERVSKLQRAYLDAGADRPMQLPDCADL